MKTLKFKLLVRWFLLALLVVQLFWLFACRKDEPEKFSLEIQGVENIASNIGETKAITLNVINSGEEVEDVILNLKDVPSGVNFMFDNSKGKPNFTATLNISITREAALGTYSLMLEAVSANSRMLYPFELVIDDDLSLSITVYDATKWGAEAPWGVLTERAVVKLYKSEADFFTNKPVLTDTTNASGKVLFYQLEPANYIFTVEKGLLSNIVQKKTVNGGNLGFVTAGIFLTKGEIYNSSQTKAQPGDLKLRDQNADGKIDDSDRMPFDELSVYQNVLNEKVIWIGN